MAQASRTFRIFVSSTFSDLKEERNALQERVFPRLRDLCLQHGARFQAIDLRWGVSDEATLDQNTIRICLDEIARCQRVTPRPNFIVLLGDRYGWRPLPAEIPADEFEEIARRVTAPADKDLLLWDESQPEGRKGWYRRDDNAVPPTYRLQPRAGAFADYDVWEKQVERPLREILLRATTDMRLTDEQRLKYQAAATEQEIVRGALQVPDAREHVFGFFRETANIQDLVRDLQRVENASAYVDLDAKQHWDEDAHAQLQTLKGQLARTLPGNIHTYDKVHWTHSAIATDHIGTLPEKLDDCLKLIDDSSAPSSLCVDVWRRLARVILQEVVQFEQVDPLDKEIADHNKFGDERARFFIGRTRELEAIREYVRGSDSHPLALWGESGSGKSALMAKAVQEIRQEHSEAQVIVRFIGATPDSSNARTLLESLCRDISRRYGADEASMPLEYKDLVGELSKRLALATAVKPLVLFLDALDQLSNAENARNLLWLPANLPANVRLIVSTLPGECLSALEGKLPASSRHQLEPLSRDEGREALELWLQDARRTLQSEQRAAVLNQFAQNGLPLYLKLAFEEARLWRSYEGVRELGADIPSIIGNLFARLSNEANHGAALLSHSLGYLAAGKNGLTEDEMLQVLSRDTQVMADFQRRSPKSPQVDQLPVVMWSRLYFDLEPYLSERSADGASLLSFYHRQLREVAEEEFLRGDEKPKRHSILASYFANQTLFDPEKKTPNIRKLSELPYQQTHGALWDDLYKTLTDFEFLEAKCTYVAVATSGRGQDVRKIHGGVYALQEDYQRALENWRGRPGPGRAKTGTRYPIIVTAVDFGNGPVIRCPACVQLIPLQEPWLGQEITCPREGCNGWMKVNPFIAEKSSRSSQ